ncbi:PTS transporter subunit EIIA [Bacillaceae bacterium SIJ1]|uniref:BglG family transcription antiterminator n=1 Tax=Litoribacterium kuwaitense TaxID=1398745 RepID=UPI0013EBFE21|nr:PTS sugar transporter subunit IIA [Litoribacterium kuwaitense]NGP46195.1 PTS transporter subunit EIIA [Litoribacterium kuwaitense]
MSKVEKHLGRLLDDYIFVLMLTIIKNIISENKTWDFNRFISFRADHYSENEVLLLNLLGTFDVSVELTKQNVLTFVREVALRVGKAFHIDFPKNISFLTHLTSHVESMIKRLQQSVKLTNPIFKEFIAEHKELFLSVKAACKAHEKLLQVKLSDQEISFIAIYFASELRKKEEALSKKAKILVVCAEGLAVSIMIKSQLEEIFESREIHTLPVREFNTSHLKEYDFIVTTVDIPDIRSHKILRINNYLQKKDIEALQKHLSLKFTNHERTLEKFNPIMQLIRENTLGIKNLSKLELELISVLSRDDHNMPKQSLPEVKFNESHISIVGHIERWEDAIKEGTASLIKQQFITKNYEKKIISNLRKFGPYMVVAPGVMIAHAGSEDGVIEDSIWVTILPNGIMLKDRYEEPIKLILTLAFKSANTHRLVENIAKLALNQEKVEEIIQLKSNEDIYTCIFSSVYS